ncbi:MAG: TadE family protein [Microbacterium sp.]|uniref:TadE family type IV pilus minor pilin n=1 Tax=Microbacterium sp. TaxID=51671 RepID=UPI001AD4654A|nr:TadE family type IV pilus minor pilin [Microbacterium sp.]MBN9177855.1 TadE family protein [Microbacterium sp.]
MSNPIRRRPRAPARWDERGSATAEFAVVLPAVVLVVALAIGGLAAAGRQVRLEHGAAQASRLAARGESDARVTAIVAAVAGGAVESVSRDGGLVCVVASAPAGVPLPLPELRARACALGEGG